jgi:hypothetical protein
MPTWRKSASMPNVRASSGTIGTTSSPISLSRSSFASMRTNTIVVEALRPSLPPWNSLKSSGSESVLSGSTWTVREGTKPPSCLRRSVR